MRYRITTAIFLAGLAVTSSSVALDGEVHLAHGSACTGKSPNDHARLAYDNYGIRNTSTTNSAKVLCSSAGFQTDTGRHVFRLAGWLDDPSMTIACTYYQTDAGGSVLWSQFQSTSPSAGGRFSLTWQITDEMFAYGYVECTLPKATAVGAAYVSTYFTQEAE